MNVYNWLCLFGVPAILLGIFKMFYSGLKRTRSDIQALKEGVQALLRGQMVSDYNKYVELGYAPIYARENFENVYKRYHTLGGNGVMTDLHNRFMGLPTERRGGEENVQD